MLHKKVTELPRTNDAGDLMDVSHLCHEKLHKPRSPGFRTSFRKYVM